MTALAKRGIKHTTLTLHVGAGTFLPVKVDDTDDHVMHSEWGEITPEAAQMINATKVAGGRIVEPTRHRQTHEKTCAVRCS